MKREQAIRETNLGVIFISEPFNKIRSIKYVLDNDKSAAIWSLGAQRAY